MACTRYSYDALVWHGGTANDMRQPMLEPPVYLGIDRDDPAIGRGDVESFRVRVGHD